MLLFANLDCLTSVLFLSCRFVWFVWDKKGNNTRPTNKRRKKRIELRLRFGCLYCRFVDRLTELRHNLSWMFMFGMCFFVCVCAQLTSHLRPKHVLCFAKSQYIESVNAGNTHRNAIKSTALISRTELWVGRD